MSSREQFEAWLSSEYQWADDALNDAHFHGDDATGYYTGGDFIYDGRSCSDALFWAWRGWQESHQQGEARCAALAADNDKAMESMRQADAVVKRAHDKYAEMAADIEALREYRPQPSGAAMMEALDAFYEYHEDVPERGMMAAFEILCCKRPKTPATDSFLAEVRAQAWIEGNEPAEFGRYWVRYETDVGPQYCSAKWMEHNFCAGSDTNIHKIWLADHSRSINSLKGVTHYTMLPEPIEGGAK